MAGNKNSGRRNDPTKRRTCDAPGDPVPPDWLDGPALDKFNELVPILIETIGSGEIDSDVLALYCDSWAEYIRLRPLSGALVRPDKKQAFDQLYKCGKELGLTPKSRLQLPAKNDMRDDPFAVYREGA